MYIFICFLICEKDVTESISISVSALGCFVYGFISIFILSSNDAGRTVRVRSGDQNLPRQIGVVTDVYKYMAEEKGNNAT